MDKPRQLTLALDASQASGSLALFGDEALLYSAYFALNITHSETLMPQLDLALKLTGFAPTQISKILLANGPGSFTGLRIGLATAKGIAYANQCVLKPFSSLKLAALPRYQCGKNILSVVDAKMKEVYAALWDAELNLLEGPRVCSPEELLLWDLGDAWVIGDGSHLIPHDSRLSRVDSRALGFVSAIGLNVLDVMEAASDEYDFEYLANLEPCYLRDYKAQIKRNN